jgi:hypothetical protein
MCQVDWQQLQQTVALPRLNMALTVSGSLIGATASSSLQPYRSLATSLSNDRELEVPTETLDVAALEDLRQAAEAVSDRKTARAIESILLARKGIFDKPVPSFKAFQGVLSAFLAKDAIDGWLYVTRDDGLAYPYLVTSVIFDNGYYGRGKGSPTVRIQMTANGYFSDGNFKEQFGVHPDTLSFGPQQVVNRRVADILAEQGAFKETQALRDAHLTALARHKQATRDAFGCLFKLNGRALRYQDDHWNRRHSVFSGRRVIHDLEPQDCGAACGFAESYIFDAGQEGPGLGSVPEHPVMSVFDLHTHESLWVHTNVLTPHQYDKSLKEKLVLPKSHRDLLDVLTTDFSAFVGDLVEGKSAGNVILCKGIPGVGKTLTAEVYAELIERPLYSIHSGSLGTTAKAIQENLEEVFQRAKRWGCVLLLDEADVFVVQRGNNIEQNAIVAEFLRTLEYFDGLLFMTTNRPNDIDEAILSRCAAIIEYHVPDAADTAAIWAVLATQNLVSLPTSLIGELVAAFPVITPRDIKMLLRLALRVSTSRNQQLDIDLFRLCAMFRPIRMTDSDAATTTKASQCMCAIGNS